VKQRRLKPLSAGAEKGEVDNFAMLAELESRLSRIDAAAPRIHAKFYDSKLRSFQIEPGVTANYSVTSTALAKIAILNSPSCEADALLSADGGGVLDSLLDAKWREDDLMQIPLVLFTVARSGTDGGAEPRAAIAAHPRLRKAALALITERPKLRDWRQQRLSTYLQFWATAALLELLDAAHDTGAPYRMNGTAPEFKLLEALGFTEEDRINLARSLERSYQVARDELCRQLAYSVSGDRNNFDVTKLACSMLTYYAVSSRRVRVALLSGERAEDESLINAPNTKMVQAALDAFFEEQTEEGLWPSGQAIYAKSRRPFEVGNAYVFAPDLLASLCEQLSQPPNLLLPYLPQMLRLTDWIDQRDPQLGRGWRSNHLPPGAPLAWSTAQTLRFAASGVQTTRTLLNDRVLAEFGGRRASGKPDPVLWQSLLDSDLPEGRSLKGVIDDRILRPRLSPAKGVVAECVLPPAYSVVLFGPPGTAKTTTCDAVAKALGYGFLVIDTSCFLADGLQNVASRIAYVFDRLRKLQDVVILFDEIEEFALDRTIPSLTMESRMLTTAMLTQLNELRRAQRSLFFIATNRISVFDSAITRPGRIDMQLFIGTPTRQARVGRFSKTLAKSSSWAQRGHSSGDAATESAVSTFDAFLGETWQSDSMFLNYLESERFMLVAVEKCTAAADFTNDVLLGILDAQRGTTLLRDARARDEYTASMQLTRL